jgi:predicted CopG family antitoxin
MEVINNTPKIVKKYNKQFHITLNKENYEKLKDLGRAGDSFNDVISKILNHQQGVFKINV